MQKRVKINLWMSGIFAAGILAFGTPVFAGPTAKAEDEDIQNSAYADVNTSLNIREGAGTEFPVSASLPKNGYCEVLKDSGDWWYIKSGEIEGYVYSKYLTAGLTREEYRRQTGNREMLYACKTGEEAEYLEAWKIQDTKRQEVVDFALRFVGNPYVWGGTSLTDGADCSGFVQSVYKNFGISLPRVASEQANAGKTILPEEALPGDLVFYADGGSIYHVVMCIGNGKAVHASSAATGIKISDIYWKHAVKAVRLL